MTSLQTKNKAILLCNDFYILHFLYKEFIIIRKTPKSVFKSDRLCVNCDKVAFKNPQSSIGTLANFPGPNFEFTTKFVCCLSRKMNFGQNSEILSLHFFC